MEQRRQRRRRRLRNLQTALRERHRRDRKRTRNERKRQEAKQKRRDIRRIHRRPCHRPPHHRRLDICVRRQRECIDPSVVRRMESSQSGRLGHEMHDIPRRNQLPGGMTLRPRKPSNLGHHTIDKNPKACILHCRVAIFWPSDDKYYRVGILHRAAHLYLGRRRG